MSAYDAGGGSMSRVEIVVVGASTGGPEAITRLLGQLPAALDVPMLVVQHMPPVFTRLLAERLDARCPFPVAEAADGARLRSGEVILAPGDHHMTVAQTGAEVRAVVGQGPPENSCRPSVDVLFRSAARVYGPGVLAVVLTGMGRDGRHGCASVREAGGRVLVQDESSSVVWGMPGSVVGAGLADAVLPLADVADALVEATSRGGRGTTASPLAERMER